MGGQKLARSWRALKGWRKLARTRSRRPLPRMIWSGVCWEMVRNKKPLMAIHILMVIVTYCRLGELLQSMREDLIRPMHGVASDWSLILHPNQRGVPSKTQCYDDTFDQKNQIYHCITKVAAVLAAGRPSDKIFEYRYEDFTKEFRRATRTLGLKDIVPYQCRHSGASLDKAGQHRTMLEIKKRGRWKSDNSIARHEKSGRLAQIQPDLTKKSTHQLRSHRLSSRAALLWETPSRGRSTTFSDGGRLFLNLFSNDRVGRAAQRLGVRTAFWNLKYGERYDVTQLVNLRQLLRDIANGEIRSCMMSVPSTGWNVARNCSRPIRSSAQPCGIE